MRTTRLLLAIEIRSVGIGRQHLVYVVVVEKNEDSNNRLFSSRIRFLADR